MLREGDRLKGGSYVRDLDKKIIYKIFLSKCSNTLEEIVYNH